MLCYVIWYLQSALSTGNMGVDRFLHCLFPPKGKLHFIYAKLANHISALPPSHLRSSISGSHLPSQRPVTHRLISPPGDSSISCPLQCKLQTLRAFMVWRFFLPIVSLFRYSSVRLLPTNAWIRLPDPMAIFFCLPLFAVLVLEATAGVVWEKNIAVWLVAGGCCWSGVRVKHC